MKSQIPNIYLHTYLYFIYIPMPDDGPYEGPKHIKHYWWTQYRIVVFDGNKYSNNV